MTNQEWKCCNKDCGHKFMGHAPLALPWPGCPKCGASSRKVDEKQDEITRLEARNARLLAALKRAGVQMVNLLLVAEVPNHFAGSFNDCQRQAEVIND